MEENKKIENLEQEVKSLKDMLRYIGGGNDFDEKDEGSSIDFKKIFNDLLKHKWLYAKVLPLAFILAALLRKASYALGGL